MNILDAAVSIAEGQRSATALLGGFVSSGRVPASMVFTGPKGSGKELAAIRFAASVICPDSGCGKCSACEKISSLEHPDLHLVYPVPSGGADKSMPVILDSRREDFLSRGEFGGRARSIGIDQARGVMAAISRQPFEAKRSVVIFFEAHLATREAQNAMLKMLEEPPPSSLIVLVTERADSLLPTIDSRCRSIRFEPLPQETIAKYLERFLSVEKGEAERISKIAAGDLRRAAALLDERFLSIRGDAAALVRLVLEEKNRRLPLESESIARRYTREETAELLEEMISILRGLMTADLAGGSATEAAEIGGKAAAAAAARDLAADIAKVSRASRNLARNVDIELTLTQLLLDLTGKWY